MDGQALAQGRGDRPCFHPALESLATQNLIRASAVTGPQPTQAAMG